MKALHERCAGLDVHKDTVVACVRVVEGGGEARHDVRRFATTTKQLLELAEWLKESACTRVGMESTGVYWKAGVARPRGGGSLRTGVGQRGAHPQRSGAQE